MHWLLERISALQHGEFLRGLMAKLYWSSDLGADGSHWHAQTSRKEHSLVYDIFFSCQLPVDMLG